MLRKIRICLQVVMMTLVTLLLLGIGFRVHLWAGWAAKIQFLPAFLAFSSVVVVIFMTTLFLGRIYCSVVCPLGIMQDFFSWLGGKVKKNRFSYAKENKVLRYGFFGVFILALIIGFAPLTTLFEPYSAYGRIVNSLFKPLYDLLNNWLAGLDAANDRYNFTEVQIWTRSVTTFILWVLSSASTRVSPCFASASTRSSAKTVVCVRRTARHKPSISKKEKSIIRAAWFVATASTNANSTR